MDTELAVRIAVRILQAAKVDDLVRANPDLEDEIRVLSDGDPSKKGKYLDWCVKQLKSGAKLEDLAPTIEAFHESQARLQKRDIGQYKSLKELENAIKDLPESKTKEKARVKQEGAKKMWENDTHVLFRIETKDACIQYGKGTRWCITMTSASYYENYRGQNVVFYFLIDKRQSGKENENENEPAKANSVAPPKKYSKIAWAVQRDMDNQVIKTEIFDANDEGITANSIPGIPEFGTLNHMVLEDAPNAPDGEIVALKKGTLPAEEAYKYLSTLDERSMNGTLMHIKKSAEYDKALVMVLRDKAKSGPKSDWPFSEIVRAMSGATPEADELILGMVKDGFPIRRGNIPPGGAYDAVFRADAEKPDFRPFPGDIDVISDPALKKEMSLKYRERLGLNGTIKDIGLLKEMLGDPDPKIRKAAVVSICVNRVYDLMDGAAADPDPDVRATLAGYASGQLHKGFFKQSDKVRPYLYGIAAKLIKDDDERVVAAVAAGVDIKEMMRATGDESLFDVIAKNPSGKVRAAAYGNPWFTKEMPRFDRDPLVQRAIAENLTLSSDEVGKMLAGDSDHIAMALTYMRQHTKKSGNEKRDTAVAKSFLDHQSPRVRYLANSIMRAHGRKHDVESLHTPEHDEDKIGWIGSNPERAKAVLKEINEAEPATKSGRDKYEEEKYSLKSHAMSVIMADNMVAYLDGSGPLPPVGGITFGTLVNVLPEGHLLKFLRALPIGRRYQSESAFPALIKRLGKKHAPEIAEKMVSLDAYQGMGQAFRMLDQDELKKYINSNHPSARRLVAMYIDPSMLPQMVNDVMPGIRAIVADRADPEHITALISDPDPKVRRKVAERVPAEHLEKMLKDKSVTVRKIVKKRLGIASTSRVSALRIACRVALS